MGTQKEHTPPDLREGVRSGILASLERDLAQRGGHTARRLLVAGVIGVVAAVGVTLLLSGHPYGHHPSWHAVMFGAVWTGLLVVCLSLMLLEVRTPSLPLARWAMAQASLKATPAPLSPACGYWLPGKRGCTTTAAAGRSAAISW